MNTGNRDIHLFMYPYNTYIQNLIFVHKNGMPGSDCCTKAFNCSTKKMFHMGTSCIICNLSRNVSRGRRRGNRHHYIDAGSRNIHLCQYAYNNAYKIAFSSINGVGCLALTVAPMPPIVPHSVSYAN